jgi:hypothetical protein
VTLQTDTLQKRRSLLEDTKKGVDRQLQLQKTLLTRTNNIDKLEQNRNQKTMELIAAISAFDRSLVDDMDDLEGLELDYELMEEEDGMDLSGMVTSLVGGQPHRDEEDEDDEDLFTSFIQIAKK